MTYLYYNKAFSMEKWNFHLLFFYFLIMLLFCHFLSQRTDSSLILQQMNQGILLPWQKCYFMKQIYIQHYLWIYPDSNIFHVSARFCQMELMPQLPYDISITTNHVPYVAFGAVFSAGIVNLEFSLFSPQKSAISQNIDTMGQYLHFC